MKITAQQLAELLGGTIEGDPQVEVFGPAKIEEASAGTITFLSNLKYESHAYTTGASILLVSNDFLAQKPIAATLLRVADVRGAVVFLLEKFGEKTEAVSYISSLAFISEKAILSKNVCVGEFSVIEDGAELGEGVVVAAQVFIGKNVKIGAKTRLFAGVKIFHDCEIGESCLIQAGSVIGSDGFGYAPQPDGQWKKLPHVGNVILENEVEIGANCCIDRATMGSTVVRRGAKLDNLIHLAHNVEIGENSILTAQVGIAGSSKIGSNVQIGGQVGVAGHLKIADGTKIQAQSGIGRNITEPNTALHGSPAIGYSDYQRSYVVFKKLPGLAKRVEELERALKKLKTDSAD